RSKVGFEGHTVRGQNIVRRGCQADLICGRPWRGYPSGGGFSFWAFWMSKVCIENDSLRTVQVPPAKMLGAQTQRSLKYFSIGRELMPREMITAYAILKKACANANFAGKRLDGDIHRLIVQACDEILAGQHDDMFPLHVWMTGSGTQFNMNVNDVISNRCPHPARTPP